MPTGGKLTAGIFLACAMVGAVWTFMFQIDAESPDMVLPLLGAAGVGFFGGWTQLGRNLGGEYVQSGVFGVGAAAVSVVYFAVLFGLRSAYYTHIGVQFATALDAILFFLDSALNVVASAILSTPTLLALVVGSFVAGVAAEFFHRRWN